MAATKATCTGYFDVTSNAGYLMYEEGQEGFMRGSENVRCSNQQPNADFHLTAKMEGPNRLVLRELQQRYADEQWVAAHMTPQQAA
jgi:hypothetical protein